MGPLHVTFDPAIGAHRSATLADERWPTMTLLVRDVMSAPVHTVTTATPLKDVARILVDHRISGVPVVDEAGAVVGVVSEADLLIKEGGHDIARRRWFGRLLGERPESVARQIKIGAITAGEAMTSPATTIEFDRSTATAATLMVDRQINRLPVLEHGRLVGIVSRADLVRAFVRTDDQLETTIRQDVLLRVLWLDPSLFDVSVRDGVATVRGHVERRSTADMIERAVRMVPGIVDVDAEVSWRFEDDRAQPVTNDPVFPFSPR
jgi:CBS domain-containing protein